MTSITAWRRFATHRLIYVFIAAVFAVGMVVYFGGVGPGGRGDRGMARSTAPIVTVNGEAVPRSDYDAQWDRMRMQMGMTEGDAQSVQMQGMVLSNLVDQALLRSIAKQRGLTVSNDEVDKQLDQTRQQMGTKAKPATDEDILQATRMGSMDDLRDAIRRQLLATKVAQALAASQPVTEDDLQKTYEQAKLRHILIGSMSAEQKVPGALPDAQAKQRAEMILAKIKSGGDFAELANEYTMDPSNKRPDFNPRTKKTTMKEQGGEMGWSPLSKYVPEFSDAARKLKPGQVSDVVKTPFGYHIIKLEEFKRELPADYAKNKTKLLADLKQQKAEEQVQKLLAGARKTAKIVWQDPTLQWRYDMTNMASAMQSGMDPRQAQDKLMAELRQVVKKNPDDSAAAQVLGQMLYSKYQSAGFKLAGNSTPPMSEQERKALRDEVIANYELALKHSTDPGHQTEFTLAELYQEAGQKDKALSHYKHIKRLLGWETDAPDAKWLHQRLRAAFVKLGETQLADEEQKQVDQITATEARKAAEQKAEAARLAAQKKADDERLAQMRKEKGGKGGKGGTAEAPPSAGTPGSGTIDLTPGSGVTVQPGGSITIPGPTTPPPGASAPKR